MDDVITGAQLQRIDRASTTRGHPAQIPNLGSFPEEITLGDDDDTGKHDSIAQSCGGDEDVAFGGCAIEGLNLTRRETLVAQTVCQPFSRTMTFRDDDDRGPTIPPGANV